MVKASAGSVRPDSVDVEFDDERLIANAGLTLIATLSRCLGIESLVDKTVRLGGRAGAARPGRKVLTLIHAIAAGADSIDDTDVLRAGAGEALLGHKAMAPSTLGTFLRAFTDRPPGRLDLFASRPTARDTRPFRCSPSPFAPSSRRFSPFTRSPVAVRLSVRVNRWIEAKLPRRWSPRSSPS